MRPIAAVVMFCVCLSSSTAEESTRWHTHLTPENILQNDFSIVFEPVEDSDTCTFITMEMPSTNGKDEVESVMVSSETSSGQRLHLALKAEPVWDTLKMEADQDRRTSTICLPNDMIAATTIIIRYKIPRALCIGDNYVIELARFVDSMPAKAPDANADNAGAG